MREWKCPGCDKVWPSLSSLVAHAESATLKNPGVCSDAIWRKIHARADKDDEMRFNPGFKIGAIIVRKDMQQLRFKIVGERQDYWELEVLYPQPLETGAYGSKHRAKKAGLISKTEDRWELAPQL